MMLPGQYATSFLLVCLLFDSHFLDSLLCYSGAGGLFLADAMHCQFADFRASSRFGCTCKACAGQRAKEGCCLGPQQVVQFISKWACPDMFAYILLLSRSFNVVPLFEPVA